MAFATKTGRILLAATALAGTAVTSQAQVYVDDIELIYQMPGASILDMKSQTFGVFGAWVKHQGGYAEFTGLGIAELYRIFPATAGELVDATFNRNTPPLLSNIGDESRSFTINLQPGESRYFAFWDAHPYRETDDEAFGWFRLTFDGQTLVVSSSATSVGNGILVGSLSAVPEPGTLQLFGLAAVALAWRASKERREQARSGASQPA